MKNRKLKTALLIGCTLIFSITGLFIGQKYFARAQSPNQLEYLPAAKPDSNRNIHPGSITPPPTTPHPETPPTINPGPKVSPPDDPATYDFSNETVGAMPRSFAPAVGNWIIGIDNANKVLVVDGRKWRQGQAAAGLADKARALYGERYAEFLDNVKAYAYYPFAVAQATKIFTSGEISVRFKAIAGRIDQGAGILFDLKPNGDYYAIRANPLENNLVLWRFKHGHRSSVSWVRNVKTPSRKWHKLRITIDENLIKGYVNGKQYLTYKLPEPVFGKIGLWTKADSVIYFDDYRAAAKEYRVTK